MSIEAAGPKPPAPFNLRPYWQLAALIVIFAVWPLVVTYLASVIADLNHCTIVETGPQPCLIFGADRGGLLYDTASLIQISYVSLPLGVLLGFLWGGVLLISWMAWSRKRRGAADATRMEVNFAYYGLALLGILGVALATLNGWLPSAILLLCLFVGIFWTISFTFALVVTLRGRGKVK